MKINLQNSNLELLKLQVQNYTCQGCSNCSQTSQPDLRSKSGILTYLILKRTCFLIKIETRIEQLKVQKEKLEGEIRGYREVLESLSVS
jgi:hypothetical protein